MAVKTFKRKALGVVSIELSLVFPVVLTIMIAVVDVARIYWAKTVLRQALMNGLKEAESAAGSVAELYDISSPTDERYQHYIQAREKIMHAIQATPLLSSIRYADLISFGFKDPLQTGANSQRGSSPFAFILPGVDGDWKIKKNGDGVDLPAVADVDPDNRDPKYHVYHSHVCPSFEVDASGKCSANRTYQPIGSDSPDSLENLIDYYPVELAAKFKIKSFILGDLTPEVRVGGYLTGGKKDGTDDCTGIRVDLWVGDGKELSKTDNQCLNDMLKFCQENDEKFGAIMQIYRTMAQETGVVIAGPNTVDDCMVGQFMFARWNLKKGALRRTYQQSMRNVYGEHYMANPSRTKGYHMPKGPKPGNANVPGTGYFRTFFLDDECNMIQRPKNACSHVFMQFRMSPLSLVWNQSKGLDESMTVVDFKLEPGISNKYYFWRASEDMPLVVWDPEHKGEIKDGSQLFGSYTQNRLWENGYKALASIDSDGDKKINGEELKNISLWFDKNRDGHSDPGEVVTAQDAGLTTLYTEYDWTDPKSNDVHASLGYERVKEGSTFAGASIDWFGRDFWSKTDAVVALIATHQQANIPVKELETMVEDYSKSGSAIRNSLFDGAWSWRVQDEQSKRSGGIFTIKSDAGTVSGHSYVEAPIEENGENISSAVVVADIAGFIEKGVDNMETINFSTQDQNGTTIKSTGYLKGGVLYGVSSLYQKTSTEPLFTYSWVASKENHPGGVSHQKPQEAPQQ